MSYVVGVFGMDRGGIGEILVIACQGSVVFKFIFFKPFNI
jgi:hypothetical protein